MKCATTSEVSYDRLTDPTDLLVARANLDWRDVENGGSCPIFSQTIPIEDRFDFTRLADLIYIGIEDNMLRLFRIIFHKTIPIQRSSDWAARITLKSIELQDIVINKLKEIGCK